MRPPFFALILTLLACGLGAGPCAADTAVAFQGLRAGAGKPVEITADQLQVNQTDGQATFSGNVRVVQGDLHMASDELIVDYVTGSKTSVDKLHANGHVLLSTPTEAAQSDKAIYSVTNSQLEMTGDVLLNQTGNTMSGSRLTVDMNTGIGHMDGRVKSVLQPGGN